jgi:hypothetical protein
MENEFDSETGGDGISMSMKPHNEHFKETAKRLREGKEAHLGHKASLDWRHDSRRVCEPGQPAENIVPVEELVAILVSCSTGKALLEDKDADKIDIRYDVQSAGSQYYPSAGTRNCVITLNPYRTKGDLLGLLTRELRRAWQHRHGALVNPLGFDPDEAILINRAQAADAFMISVRAAWELKLSGAQEAWNHLAGSPMADIGRIFEIKAQTDFRTLNNGEASRAAYDKFFEDYRTKVYDKRLIHQMLLDENGYMRKGGNTKSPRIDVDLFKRLGTMPMGKNYLSLASARMPTDSCYATVEDRSNANFLWFIKFERSFHIKELEMMQESVKLSAEIVDFARWSLQRGVVPTGETGL